MNNDDVILEQEKEGKDYYSQKRRQNPEFNLANVDTAEVLPSQESTK